MTNYVNFVFSPEAFIVSVNVIIDASISQSESEKEDTRTQVLLEYLSEVPLPAPNSLEKEGQISLLNLACIPVT